MNERKKKIIMGSIALALSVFIIIAIFIPFEKFLGVGVSYFDMLKKLGSTATKGTRGYVLTYGSFMIAIFTLSLIIYGLLQFIKSESKFLSPTRAASSIITASVLSIALSGYTIHTKALFVSVGFAPILLIIAGSLSMIGTIALLVFASIAKKKNPQPAQSAANLSAPYTVSSMQQELDKLETLRKEGRITEEEFNAMRKKILGL